MKNKKFQRLTAQKYFSSHFRRWPCRVWVLRVFFRVSLKWTINIDTGRSPHTAAWNQTKLLHNCFLLSNHCRMHIHSLAARLTVNTDSATFYLCGESLEEVSRISCFWIYRSDYHRFRINSQSASQSCRVHRKSSPFDCLGMPCERKRNLGVENFKVLCRFSARKCQMKNIVDPNFPERTRLGKVFRAIDGSNRN